VTARSTADARRTGSRVRLGSPIDVGLGWPDEPSHGKVASGDGARRTRRSRAHHRDQRM